MGTWPIAWRPCSLQSVKFGHFYIVAQYAKKRLIGAIFKVNKSSATTKFFFTFDPWEKILNFLFFFKPL